MLRPDGCCFTMAAAPGGRGRLGRGEENTCGTNWCGSSAASEPRAARRFIFAAARRCVALCAPAERPGAAGDHGGGDAAARGHAWSLSAAGVQGPGWQRAPMEVRGRRLHRGGRGARDRQPASPDGPGRQGEDAPGGVRPRPPVISYAPPLAHPRAQTGPAYSWPLPILGPCLFWAPAYSGRR